MLTELEPRFFGCPSHNPVTIPMSSPGCLFINCHVYIVTCLEMFRKVRLEYGGIEENKGEGV
jgi:hypothetical protein